jgi:hypothetical protein
MLEIGAQSQPHFHETLTRPQPSLFSGYRVDTARGRTYLLASSRICRLCLEKAASPVSDGVQPPRG